MLSNYTLIVLIIVIIYCLITKKEGFKKQRRQNIRSGWRRKGKAGVTLSKNGTRYPKLPPGYIATFEEDDD